LRTYEQFLEVNYNDVKTNFTKMFLPDYLPPENENEAEQDIFYRIGSEDEQKFVCAVVDQVEGLIIRTTFKLQLELDRKEETQTITSIIAAKFKRDAILTATEATALAIHDTSPTNQDNMELHIKKLIKDAINKKIKKPSHHLPHHFPPLLLPLLPKVNEKTPKEARNPYLCHQKAKGEKQ
jgi:hypothetical protein